MALDPETIMRLQDTENGEVISPSYIILTYSVCALDEKSCAWRGWLLEGAFEVTGKTHNSGTGDRVVAAVTNQICPNCGKQLFRTIVQRHYAAMPIT